MARDTDTADVDRAALKTARRAEREIAAAYIAEFAWPTVLLFLVLVSAWVTVVALASSGRIPLFLGLAINTVMAYACDTVCHKANQGNIIAGRASPRWIDPLLGSVVALPITLSFRGFAGRSTIKMRRFDQAALVGLLAAFALGYGSEALLLWRIPGKLSGFILMASFQWLPHHPHTATQRYGNTRINVFLLSTPALLEQDHHLMHHLSPRVPWYRHRSLFSAMRALLEEGNAHIECRRLESDVPRIALR
jgi:fatty acid desaturase